MKVSAPDGVKVRRSRSPSGLFRALGCAGSPAEPQGTLRTGNYVAPFTAGRPKQQELAQAFKP